MKSFFPPPIIKLPEIDLPFKGVRGYLVQGENEQVVFLEFGFDVDVPKHSHESQWEVVLDGTVEYCQDGKKTTYRKGDRFFVPKGKTHSARVYAGYRCMIFFNQKNRYKKKQ